MITKNKEEIYVVDHSPIKFAIIGAKGRSRRVLVKSSNAGLDLLGSFSVKSDKPDYQRKSFLSNFLTTNQNYNIAKSHDKYRINDSDDMRTSDYWFLWQGYATSNEKDLIEKEFNKRIVDIDIGIKESKGGLEWSIAPIITLCNNASNSNLQKVKRSKFLMIITVVTYVVTAFTLLINKSIF